MARDFKILEKDYIDWLFKDEYHRFPDKSVCYRHVIEHDLFYLLRDKFYSIKDVEKTFREFKVSFDDGSNYISDENFLTLYFLNLSELNRACLLIDRSRWCYPLVFDSKIRIDGFANSLRNIENNLSNVIAVLESYKNLNNEWNEDLQEKLNIFDDRKDG